jgi:hypothetical protein
MSAFEAAVIMQGIMLIAAILVIYFAVTVLKRLSEISNSLRNIEAKLILSGEPESHSPIKENKE